MMAVVRHVIGVSVNQLLVRQTPHTHLHAQQNDAGVHVQQNNQPTTIVR